MICSLPYRFAESIQKKMQQFLLLLFFSGQFFAPILAVQEKGEVATADVISLQSGKVSPAL